MIKKESTKEKYERMDKQTSRENWNDGLGLIVIEVFERAVKKGEEKKTVRQLVDEIEEEL